MKLDWQALTFVVTLILGMVGWGVSVEVRLSQNQNQSIDSIKRRLKEVEDNMLPLLVDAKVRERLKEMGESSADENNH